MGNQSVTSFQNESQFLNHQRIRFVEDQDISNRNLQGVSTQSLFFIKLLKIKVNFSLNLYLYAN